jgi:LysM repeat protein
MQKDFKTGMALGLVLITVVIVWLSTRPSLSVKARVLSRDSVVHCEIGTAGPQKETAIGGDPAKQASNEQPKEVKTERIHVVRNGETLSDISRQYYGSADKWQKILGADHLPIENPSKLRPGTKLIVPE